MQRYYFFCVFAKLFVPLSAEMKNNRLPHYITNKQNALLLVLMTALFTELFFFIFEPFNARELMPNDWQYLLWITVMVGIAIALVGISRTILYFVSKKRELTIINYSGFILGEVVSMSVVYTLFLLFVFHDFAIASEWTFFPLYKDIMLGTAFILLIPYTILHLAFAYRNANSQLQELANGQQTETESVEKYNFYDEKGELKLSVKPDMVYYLEAADNYVQIHYVVGTKHEQTMIRNTLKNIEWRFRDKDLIRCHRSYIVNLKNVKVLRREEGEVVIDFGKESIPAIPVSKGYATKVMECFTQ